MKHTNTESGLTFYDGLPASNHAARQVAMRRHARQFQRLRERIDEHGLRTSRRARPGWQLPPTLRAWTSKTSAGVRAAFPELSALVSEIDALTLQRAAMRRDPSYVPPSTDKRVPLPRDPIARKLEETRRAVDSMRKLRARRRWQAAGFTENLDLVGG